MLRYRIHTCEINSIVTPPLGTEIRVNIVMGEGGKQTKTQHLKSDFVFTCEIDSVNSTLGVLLSLFKGSALVRVRAGVLVCVCVWVSVRPFVGRSVRPCVESVCVWVYVFVRACVGKGSVVLVFV